MQRSYDPLEENIHATTATNTLDHGGGKTADLLMRAGTVRNRTPSPNGAVQYASTSMKPASNHSSRNVESHLERGSMFPRLTVTWAGAPRRSLAAMFDGNGREEEVRGQELWAQSVGGTSTASIK